MSEKNKKNVIIGIILVVLVSLLALTGCAQIEVTPPKPRPDAPKSHLLPVNYDRLWSRAIGWFDAHEAEITDIDERNGLIYGIVPVATGSDRLDCGTFHINSPLSRPQLTQSANVRVQMRGVLSTHPQVLVVVTGTYKLDLIDNYAAQTIRRTGPCVSRGTLESEILSFLVG